MTAAPCPDCGLSGCAGCLDGYGVADEPSRVDPQPTGWVVEFDYRADNGERHVGPFSTKAEGQAWLARQTFDYEALVTPMGAPDGT